MDRAHDYKLLEATVCHNLLVLRCSNREHFTDKSVFRRCSTAGQAVALWASSGRFLECGDWYEF